MFDIFVFVIVLFRYFLMVLWMFFILINVFFLNIFILDFKEVKFMLRFL